MYELVNEAPFLSITSELDNVASLCFRALDGSNYDVRCEVAKLLGHLLAQSQLLATSRQAQQQLGENIQLSQPEPYEILTLAFSPQLKPKVSADSALRKP